VAIPLPTFTPDHLHPILVNFTAALVPASVGSDVLGRALRKPSMHTAAWWMVLYAAAVTPLTVLSGLWWKHGEKDMLPPKLIAEHQWLGIGLAVCFVVLAVWRFGIYKRNVPPSVAYLILGIVLVAALVVQGALGGQMLLG
jgi:uncharacterized membrane protein